MTITKLFNLSGNVAVITDGNGGIGRGIAIGLGNEKKSTHTELRKLAFLQLLCRLIALNVPNWFHLRL